MVRKSGPEADSVQRQGVSEMIGSGRSLPEDTALEWQGPRLGTLIILLAIRSVTSPALPQRHTEIK